MLKSFSQFRCLWWVPRNGQDTMYIRVTQSALLAWPIFTAVLIIKILVHSTCAPSRFGFGRSKTTRIPNFMLVGICAQSYPHRALTVRPIVFCGIKYLRPYLSIFLPFMFVIWFMVLMLIYLNLNWALLDQSPAYIT